MKVCYAIVIILILVYIWACTLPETQSSKPLLQNARLHTLLENYPFYELVDYDVCTIDSRYALGWDITVIDHGVDVEILEIKIHRENQLFTPIKKYTVHLPEMWKASTTYTNVPATDLACCVPLNELLDYVVAETALHIKLELPYFKPDKYFVTFYVVDSQGLESNELTVPLELIY